MNIYEQAVKQAKIDKEQRVLDRKVHFSRMKSRERDLLERLDSLGITYEKDRLYRMDEEEFINTNSIHINYKAHTYPEKVNDGYGGYAYPYCSIEIKQDKYILDKHYLRESSHKELDSLIKSICKRIMEVGKYYTNK
jgi:hypothetical protein